MELITKSYSEKIDFVIGCFNRLVFTGTLSEISYAKGMNLYLYKNDVRVFDYPRFAEPFKNTIRENAERLGKENGVSIEFIRKAHIRKEDVIAEWIRQREVAIRREFK